MVLLWGLRGWYFLTLLSTGFGGCSKQGCSWNTIFLEGPAPAWGSAGRQGCGCPQLSSETSSVPKALPEEFLCAFGEHFIPFPPSSKYHLYAEDPGGQSEKGQLCSRLAVPKAAVRVLTRGAPTRLTPGEAYGPHACAAVPSPFAKVCPKGFSLGVPCPTAAGNSSQSLGQFPSAPFLCLLSRQLSCSTRPCCCLPCPAALCLLPGSCLVLDPLSDPRKVFSCLRCSSGRPAFCAPCSGSTHWDYNRGFPCEGK